MLSRTSLLAYLVAALTTLVGTSDAFAALVTTTFDGTVGTSNDRSGLLQDGGTLVGTSFDPSNDNDPGPVKGDRVNAVIAGLKSGSGTDGYNREFANQLALVDGILGKHEPGSLTYAADFQFYKLDPSGTDGTWNGASLTTILDSDVFSHPIVGLKWDGAAGGDADIGYVVAKTASTNSGGGFSVWEYKPGVLNVVYVDMDGDQTFTMPGGDYVFDASANKKGELHALSHVAFYSSGTTIDDPPPVTTTPEPASSVLFLIGAASALGYRRRRSA